MLHTNLTALSSTEQELLPIEVLHCSCDLDLDPMTFICELDPYLLKISLQIKNELSTSTLSKVFVLHTDIHTYIQVQPKNYNTASRLGTRYSVKSHMFHSSPVSYASRRLYSKQLVRWCSRRHWQFLRRIRTTGEGGGRVSEIFREISEAFDLVAG